MLLAAVPRRRRAVGTAPDHVDITWMSVTNMYFELGPLGVLADGT
jgi:hypothetical protein